MFFNQRKTMVEMEEKELAAKKQLIVELLNPVVANIYYWSRYDFDQEIFDSTYSIKSEFQDEFGDFIVGMNHYSQFRLINNQGQEILRLVRNDEGIIINDTLLQNKSNRNYFKKTLALRNGEIYLSPLNLNVENEEIEIPYKPMIRGSAVVYSATNKKLGIVVINYNTNKLLKLLNNNLEHSFFLLDGEGHFLSNSENRDKEFIHLLRSNNKTGFNTEQPDIWKEISDEGNSKIYKNGVWISDKLNFKNTISSSSIIGNQFAEIETVNEWYLIAHLTNTQILASIKGFYLSFLLINLLILGIVIYVASIEVKNEKQKHKYIDQLRKKTNTLENQNILLSAVKEKLELRNRQLKEYNNIVAHNLRAPTTSMSALVSMVNNTNSYHEVKTYLPKLNTITRSINTLVSDLLVYVRVLNNNTIKIEKINIEPIIQTTLGLYTETIDQEVIQVHIDLNAWKTIEFSKVYMQSVLQNLISNAIKYRDPEKKSFVKIKTIKKGDECILEISDNGLGINLQKRKNEIFKLYRRFHRNISGKGMGLFLVKTQLEALNATIKVESEINKGAKFIITFNKKIDEYEIFPN